MVLGSGSNSNFSGSIMIGFSGANAAANEMNLGNTVFLRDIYDGGSGQSSDYEGGRMLVATQTDDTVSKLSVGGNIKLVGTSSVIYFDTTLSPLSINGVVDANSVAGLHIGIPAYNEQNLYLSNRSDGDPASAGDVLTSDGTGNWYPAAAGGGGLWSQSSGNLYPTTITDKVLIGDSTAVGFSIAQVTGGLSINAGGSIVFFDNTNTNYVSLSAGSPNSSYSLIWPQDPPNNGDLLAYQGASVMEWVTPSGSSPNLVETAIDYDMDGTETIVGVTDTSSSRLVRLPLFSNSVEGQIYEIKDESYGAGTNSITISIQEAVIIDDNSGDPEITENGGSLRFYRNSTQWFSL
jgi:hypothetical protein